MTDRSKAALPSGSSMQRAVMSACLWYSSNLVTIVYFAGKNQLNHKFGRLHECETDFRAPAHPVSSPLLVSLLFLFRAGVEVDCIGFGSGPLIFAVTFPEFVYPSCDTCSYSINIPHRILVSDVYSK